MMSMHAHTAIDIVPVREALGTQVLQASLLALLFLVLITLEPFKVRNLTEVSSLASGDGDVLRQASYSIIFAVVIIVSLNRWRMAALAKVPRSIYLVIVWCVLSIIWSAAPDISARRLALTAMIVLTVFLIVHGIGAQRTLRVVYFALTATLILNLCSIPLVPHAVHLAGEADRSLVGNWRGVHFHKNIAGSVAGISALFFFHFALRRRRRDWLLFVLAVVFTIGTSSRTSMLLLATAVPLTLVYHWVQTSARRVAAFRLLSYVTVGYMLVVAIPLGEQISAFLSDPSVFTGRGAVWQLALTYLAERPFLGAGFAAFWQAGGVSPLMEIVRDGWLLSASHSHNGYLEIAVTTGVIGLVLSIFAFVLLPARTLLRIRAPHNGLVWSIFVFFVMLNLTETRLMDRDRPEWVLFLVMLSILSLPCTERVDTDA